MFDASSTRAPERLTAGRAAARVTWLLPVRNGARTLGPCLRSLQRQSMPHWECVAVDDGSTDPTRRMLQEAADRDPRIRVLPREAMGIVPALNAGLAAVRTPWVARIDADDVAHRHRLRRQLAAAEQGDWVLCGAHPRLFPQRNLQDGMRQYGAWLRSIRTSADVFGQRFVECPLAHPTWLGQTSVLQGLGYRDEGWPEDYDLLLRLLLTDRQRVGIVPRQLLGWRHHERRTSRCEAAYSKDAFVRCKAHHLIRGPLRDSDRYLLWGYGGTGRALRRHLLAWDRTPSHIIDLHPGRAGQTIHGAPVVAPAEVAGLPPYPMLISVAQPNARRDIAAALRHTPHRPVFVA